MKDQAVGRKIHALVKHRNGYIVFKRRDGDYDLPHDYRREKEQRHDALDRILDEQLGIVARLEKFLGTAQNEQTGDEEHYYLVEALGEKFYLGEKVKRDKGYESVVATTAEQILREEVGYLPAIVITELKKDKRFSRPGLNGMK
tara:strand:- start:823 stop:1254 length:432 start_codon:yes stop_codon:yes gene_type:complete